MKKYKRKEEVLVFQWTGDKEIVDTINELLSPINKIHEVEFKVKILEDGEILCLIQKDESRTTSSFLRIGEYMIIDPNEAIFSEFLPISRCSEEFIEKYYTEI
jgi:folylpolyglutamate synthase/dihydropteroate synthase